MKRSSGLRSGGIRKKAGSPAPPEPDGIRVVSGKVRVRDRAYMKALHEAQTPPLDITPVTGEESWGKLELHHQPHPDRASRRQNDAGVVPLRAADHAWVEMNPVEERNLLGPLFGTWAAFSYFCHVRGVDPRSVGAGQQFLKEVLLWLHQDS